MAIQIRSQTATSGQASATAFGVGLNNGDGGAGAWQRGLNQVAQGASQIAGNLAAKNNAANEMQGKLSWAKRTVEKEDLENQITAANERGATDEAATLTLEYEDRYSTESKNFKGVNHPDYQAEGYPELDSKTAESYMPSMIVDYGSKYGSIGVANTSARHTKTTRDFVANQKTTLGRYADEGYTDPRVLGLSEHAMGGYVETNGDAQGPEMIASVQAKLEEGIVTYVDRAAIAIAEGTNVDDMKAQRQEWMDAAENNEWLSAETRKHIEARFGKPIKDVVNYEAYRRIGNVVTRELQGFATDSSPTLDVDSLQVTHDKATAAMSELEPDSQQYNMFKDQAAVAEAFMWTQDPANAEAYKGKIESAIDGTYTWDGDPEANEFASAMVKERYDRLAAAYSAPDATSSDRLAIISPAYDTEIKRIWSDENLSDAEKFRNQRTIEQQLSGARGADAPAQFIPLSKGQQSRAKIELPDGQWQPFDVNMADEKSAMTVYDGDTFYKYVDGKKVGYRLYSTDTPELDKYWTDENEDPTGIGQKTTEWVEDFLKGKKFKVVPMGADKSNDSGRILAEIVFEDGTSLSKIIANNFMGIDGPNLGKNEIFGHGTSAYTPEEEAAVLTSAALLDYNLGREVPQVRERAAQLFKLNDDGKTYTHTEGEILAGLSQYFTDAQAGGYDLSAIYDTHSASEDPALQTMAAAAKIYSAVGGGMDSPALQALVFDDVVEGTTKSRMVDPALRLINTSESDYGNTARIISSLRGAGDEATANILEGYAERSVNYLISSDPEKYNNPEALAQAADSLLSEAFSFIDFSSVSGMKDTAIPASVLRYSGIKSSFFARILSDDTISPRLFAGTVKNAVVKAFTEEYSQSAEPYVYDKSFEDNPYLSDGAKDTYRRVNTAFRSLFHGNATELDFLVENGDVRMVFDATDDKGVPQVAYRVRQKNGGWKLAKDVNTGKVLSIPFEVLKPVFNDPLDYAERTYKADERNQYKRRMDNYSPTQR